MRCGCCRRRDGRAIGRGRRDGSVWDDVVGRDREVSGGLRGVREVVRIIVVALAAKGELEMASESVSGGELRKTGG